MPTITALDGAAIEVSDAAASEISKRQAQIRMAKAETETAKAEAGEIRRAVVAARLGDAAVAGKPAEYIDAAFTTILATGARSGGPDMRERDEARAEYIASLNESWKH